jgi:hypothetical protein
MVKEKRKGCIEEEKSGAVFYCLRIHGSNWKIEFTDASERRN